MDIDIYQACPCQSGKKIKFCCSKDILPDLNQILSLHHGKQFKAAVEKIERLSQKIGGRACLTGLKTHILIHLKDYQEATRSNNEFLLANPRNPLGYQHAALLMAAEGRSAEAVSALQNGMDACASNQVPVTMANAFRTVGMMLMSQGNVVAGRAHLIFASELRQGEDEVVAQLIMQSFRSPEIPLLLKSEFPVLPPGEDLPEGCAGKLENTMRFAGRGRWRAARILTEKLSEQFPDQAEVIYAIAVYSLFLGDTRRAREALLEYSALATVDHDRAVEARATSFVVDEQSVTGAYDFVRTSYAIADVESFNEQLIACRRVVTGSIFSHHFIDETSPPPLSGYLLLDHDEVQRFDESSSTAYPQVVGELLVYGRQTNAEARVDFFAVRDREFDALQIDLKSLFADLSDEAIQESVVEQVNILDHDMSFKWHLPADMSLEKRQEFVAEQREHEYLDILPTVSFHPLNGRTIIEALENDDAKLDVEALVLMMEQGADAQASNTFEFNKIREKFDLPVPKPIDINDRDFDRLSPVETQRVDFENLPDELLIRAFVLASSSGNIRVLRDASPVILSRPEMEKYIRFEMVYTVLARLAIDTDHALELMQKARRHASASERPIGGLLIDELELRLERNRPEGCQELLRVLQANHLQDPQNQYRLAAVLQKFGIMGQDGRLRSDSAESAEPVPAATASGDVWTPGDPAATVAPTDSGDTGKSKLWLPE